VRATCRSCGAEGTLYQPMRHTPTCPFAPRLSLVSSEPTPDPVPVQTSADCRALEDATQPCRFASLCSEERRATAVAAGIRGKFCSWYQREEERALAQATHLVDATGEP
jgi:hypothetical protein